MSNGQVAGQVSQLLRTTPGELAFVRCALCRSVLVELEIVEGERAFGSGFADCSHVDCSAWEFLTPSLLTDVVVALEWSGDVLVDVQGALF